MTERKKKQKKGLIRKGAITVFAIFALIMIVPILLGVFVFNQDQLNADNSTTQAEKILIALNDIKPGSFVSYDVLADEKLVASGGKNVDLSGQIALPGPSAEDITDESETLSYKLEIKEPINSNAAGSNPLNLFLQVHQKTGEVSFNGSGLDEFEDITFMRGGQKERFKTDWAGMFAERIKNKDSAGSFKLAFQDFNIAGDIASSQNPAITKVQSTAFSCIPASMCTTPAHPCGGGEVWCRVEIPDPLDPTNDILVNRCEPTGSCCDAWSNCGSAANPVWSSSSTSVGPWCPNPTTNIPCETDPPPESPGGASTTAACGINYTPTLFGNTYVPTLNDVQKCWTVSIFMMTHQLSAVMGSQVSMIGSLLDAKHQLEVQRRMQELQARAHKDYHPSEQICRYGTFVRSLAHAETKLEMEKHALNRILMDQYLGVQNNHTGQGQRVGAGIMRELYKTKYCDKRDNNDSLDLVCTTGTTAAARERYNKDIDYARTFDRKLTLDVDFFDTTASADEEDLIALAQNLYFAQMFEDPDVTLATKIPERHHESRSLAAKLNIAHNSYINIIGMKSNAPLGAGADAGWNYMKSMLREFGFANDAEIHAYLGDQPSYYAQMEVLTKKIYQHPNFYTNLYDKPVNVDRMGITLDAISLMNQRDRFDSMLRREMLTSMLIEESLGDLEEDLSVRIYQSMRKKN